jgi:Predicted transcriptional regulator
MNKNINITDSEWLIMSALWEKSPQTSAEIIKTVEVDTAWKPTTIQTLISRLTKKSMIKVDKTSSTYLYTPLVTKEDCTRQETKSFIKKVYNDSLQLFVANFLKEANLSNTDIEELKRILDDKKE